MQWQVARNRPLRRYSSAPSTVISIHPLKDIGEVVPGDDLVAILHDALKAAGLLPLNGEDVLVVTQKIVSKAEGRFVDLGDVTPGAEALRLAEVTRKDARLVELVLAESSAVVRSVPHVLITRHRLGHVMANSGIDRSNIGPEGGERALLLPLDPDGTAQRLRETLGKKSGAAPAVVISDSFGRPWRMGVVGVAIGASGLPSLIDRRGEEDRDGRPMEVTQIAFGDIIATAASLATGEGAEGIPAVLIRGLTWPDGSLPASALVRSPDEDLFR